MENIILNDSICFSFPDGFRKMSEEEQQPFRMWEYSCDYNEEDNTLISMPTGTRTEFVYNEAGNIESFNDVYNDGNAVFALDEEGYLIWHDEKEDAGKDMRFEWVEIIDFENNGI